VLVVYVIFHVLLLEHGAGAAHLRRRRQHLGGALSGINVDRTLLIVYTLTGLMAGVAALVLAGRTNSGYPTAGAGYELDAIAAVIIGGASFSRRHWHSLGDVDRRDPHGGAAQWLGAAQSATEWQIVAIGLVIIGAVYIDVLRQRGAPLTLAATGDLSGVFASGRRGGSCTRPSGNGINLGRVQDPPLRPACG